MNARMACAALCKPFVVVLLTTLGTLGASVLVLLAVAAVMIPATTLVGGAGFFAGDMAPHLLSIARNAVLTGMVIGVAANLKAR